MIQKTGRTRVIGRSWVGHAARDQSRIERTTQRYDTDTTFVSQTLLGKSPQLLFFLVVCGLLQFPSLVSGQIAQSHAREVFQAILAAELAYAPTDAQRNSGYDYNPTALLEALQARFDNVQSVRLWHGHDNELFAYAAESDEVVLLAFRGSRGHSKRCVNGESPVGLETHCCPVGYNSDGALFCYKACPEGWSFTVAHCQKPRNYSPGKPILLECPPGKISYLGLCYDVPEEFEMASAGRATKPCPQGWRDDGTACWQDLHINNANTSSCPWYDACGLTFARGCSTCSQEGYINDGCTCRRPPHRIPKETRWLLGTPLVPACPVDYQLNALKSYCYVTCPVSQQRPGYDLEFCSSTCPLGTRDIGIGGCERIRQAASESAFQYSILEFIFGDTIAENEVWKNLSPNWQMNYRYQGILSGEGMPGVWTHRGLANGVAALYPSIKEYLNQLNNAADRNGSRRKLLITGHSMGGALAGYTAYRLMDDNLMHSGDILITFGAPRVAYQACSAGHPNSFQRSFDFLLNQTGSLAFYAEVPGDDVPKSTDPSLLCPQPLGINLNFEYLPDPAERCLENPANAHAQEAYANQAAMHFLTQRGPHSETEEEAQQYCIGLPLPLLNGH